MRLLTIVLCLLLCVCGVSAVCFAADQTTASGSTTNQGVSAPSFRPVSSTVVTSPAQETAQPSVGTPKVETAIIPTAPSVQKLVQAVQDQVPIIPSSKGTVSTSTDFSYVTINGLKYLSSMVQTYTEKDNDGSTSTTKTSVSFTYDAAGKLTSAIGRKTIVSRDGRTGETTKLSGTQTYTVANGQLLLARESFTGTVHNKDGRTIGTVVTMVTNSYALYNGKYQLTKSVTINDEAGVDRSRETITRTATYQRDATGKCIGMKQTATGTMSVVTGSSWGQTSRATYTLTNYKATIALDPKRGYYVASESMTWTKAP